MGVRHRYGDDDRRVPGLHAERMLHALQKAGKAVDYRVEKNEAHGFFDEKNREEMYDEVLRFLGCAGSKRATFRFENANKGIRGG